MDSHLLRFDKKKKIVIFDLETENLCLNFRYNRPWQFAFQIVQGDQLIKAENFYIKWERPLNVGAQAAKVTGYDSVRVAKLAEPADEVFEAMDQQFESCDYILGHNILGFDMSLIKEWYERMGKQWRHLMQKLIDTHCVAKGIEMNLPYRPDDNLLCYLYKMYHLKAKGIKTNLTFLGKKFKIEHDYDNCHKAEVDIDLNRKIWNQLKFQIEL